MTPLTHAERQELIHKPFPVVQYVLPKSWAGTLIPDHDLSDNEIRYRAAHGRITVRDSLAANLLASIGLG